MKRISWVIGLVFLPVIGLAQGENFEKILKKNFTKPALATENKIAPGARVRIQKVYPTFFLVEEKEGLYQLVRIELEGEREKGVIIKALRAGGLSYENPVSGKNEFIIKVPDLRENGELILKLIQSGKEIQSLKFDWTPVRLWKVYISFVSHLDLGYTNTTEKVFEKRNQITERALEYIKQTDDFPKEAQFRWTMEGAWELKHFLEEHPERLEELKQRAQENRLELTAKLVHMHSETAGYEELFRELYYAKIEGENLLGVPVLTAMHNDVDGFTWGEVSVLSSAGIKYFSFNPNTFYRGGNILHQTKFPQAFYWRGPGPGEILTWRSKNAYTELPYAGFSSYLFEGYSKTLEGLTELLSSYEQEKYPYDAIHLTRSGADKGGANDNSWPRIEGCYSIKEWNEHFAYPRLISATPKQFFSYLEKNFLAQIPEARGDMPDWWADGVITEAKWTAMSRDLHHLLYQAEALASLASILDPSYQYPQKEINDAYYNNILFDEHTWGYMLPTAPQHQQIFNLKASWLKNAYEDTQGILKIAQDSLLNKISPPGLSLIVFNSLSWERNELVSFDWGKNLVPDFPGPFVRIIDPETKKEIPVQVETISSELSRISFIATDIPALGYKSYQLVPSQTQPEYPINLVAENNRLENERYLLKWDKHRGLVSIHDKKLKRELLSEPMGQLIARKQDLLFNWIDLRKKGRQKLEKINTGPVFAEIRFQLDDPFNPQARLIQSILFYQGLDYFEIKNSYSYKNHLGESRYFVFPFKVPDFEIWVETPYGKMRPYYDQLPDFAKFYAVSHYVELRSKSENFSIIWSTKEAPMIELGKITKKASYTSQMIWPLYYDPGIYPWNPSQPYIYSEIMNNFQNTNFSSSQQGTTEFHYRIKALDSQKADKAHYSGWELATPVIAVVSQKGSGKFPAKGSFIQVAPDNVMITSFKKAEDKIGYILRIYEARGKQVEAHLQFPLFNLKEAILTDGIEREREKIFSQNNKIVIELKPFEVKTIKLKFSSPL